MSDKVIRDGKVAVIVSPGFGVGWATWNDADDAFDPEIVAWIEGGKNPPYEVLSDDDDRDPGGLSETEIHWLPVGTKFRIHEFDGSEYLELASDVDWQVA